MTILSGKQGKNYLGWYMSFKKKFFLMLLHEKWKCLNILYPKFEIEKSKTLKNAYIIDWGESLFIKWVTGFVSRAWITIKWKFQETKSEFYYTMDKESQLLVVGLFSVKSRTVHHPQGNWLLCDCHPIESLQFLFMSFLLRKQIKGFSMSVVVMNK